MMMETQVFVWIVVAVQLLVLGLTWCLLYFVKEAIKDFGALLGHAARKGEG